MQRTGLEIFVCFDLLCFCQLNWIVLIFLVFFLSVFIWTLSGCFFPLPSYVFFCFVLLKVLFCCGTTWCNFGSGYWTAGETLFAEHDCFLPLAVCTYVPFSVSPIILELGDERNICCWFFRVFVLLNWYSFLFAPPLEYESMFSTLPKRMQAYVSARRRVSLQTLCSLPRKCRHCLGLYKQAENRFWPAVAWVVWLFMSKHVAG